MKTWVILLNLGILVIGMGQKDLQAQSFQDRVAEVRGKEVQKTLSTSDSTLDDVKEIKKEFHQYLQQQRPITSGVIRKVIKDGEKDYSKRWAAAGWYRTRDKIKDSAPWNKRYGWQPTDNLPPLEPATTTTTVTGGGGGVGGGKKR